MQSQVVRERLETALREHTPAPRIFRNDGDCRPGSTNHPADSASDTALLYEDEAKRKVLLKVRSQIEQALAKLDQGTYGQCDSCQGKIEPERLEIQPWSITCCACVRKADQRSRH